MSGKNYAAGSPLGNNQNQVYSAPPSFKAVATTARSTTPTVSSILILSQNTTGVEISSAGGPTVFKWLYRSTVDSSVASTSVIATGATADFDHIVPNDTYRRFVIPQAVNNPQGYGSFVGGNVENGLYTHIAYAGLAAASIVSITQYGSSNSY